MIDPKVSQSSATPEDIRACYRLLLGREPDEGGFRTWSDFVLQQRLNPLDLALHFLNSAEYKYRRGISAAPGYAYAEADGLTFVVPEDDLVAEPLVRYGRYETWVKDRILSALRPGGVMIDIGSNIGYHATLAARAVGPAGKVIAIDAAASNARLSLLNARRNGFRHVQVLCVAMSDKVETLVYSLEPGQSNAQMYEPKDQDVQTMHVALGLPLDALLPGIPRVDVIKMDIEGFEHKCVLGAENLLRRCRPGICAEYSPNLIKKSSGVEGVVFLNHMFSMGYRGTILLHDGTQLDCGTNAARIHEFWQRDWDRAGIAHADLWFAPA